MTMYNIREFLEQGTYVLPTREDLGPPAPIRCTHAYTRHASRLAHASTHRFKESAAAKAEGVKKEPSLIIRRAGTDGKEMLYQVTDTISSIPDWYGAQRNGAGQGRAGHGAGQRKE